jgi:hypothetical protein
MQVFLSDSKLGTLTIDKTLDIVKLLGDGRISVGDPAHVPAGKYAQDAFTFFGWTDALKTKLLPAKEM